MKIFIFLALASTTLAEEAPPPPAHAPSSAALINNNRGVLNLNPKERASDYVQAFNMLRKEKPTLKISIRTSNDTLSNVTDLSTTHNGTLFFVKLLTAQGNKIQILPIEELVEISYTP